MWTSLMTVSFMPGCSDFFSTLSTPNHQSHMVSKFLMLLALCPEREASTEGILAFL